MVHVYHSTRLIFHYKNTLPKRKVNFYIIIINIIIELNGLFVVIVYKI